MPELCDAGCQKLLLDSGMAQIAADMYGRTIIRVNDRAPNQIRPVDMEAPLFFRQVAALFEESARRYLEAKPSKAEKAALLEQLQKQCYRADELIAWSLKGDDQFVQHAAAWTAKLFAWAKEDQTFFLEHVAGVKPEEEAVDELPVKPESPEKPKKEK